MLNVTGPVKVPAVVALTVAVNVMLLPKAKLVGFAVTVVVVAAVPEAATITVTLELDEPV